MQDVVVVGLDLRPTGPFLEARLRAALLHGAATEHGRRDAVEHRRLVELDERIRVLPVPAGRVATVDERDVDVGVIDQGVGERHAHGARAHDQVVGLQRSHRHAPRPPAASRRSAVDGCYEASTPAGRPSRWVDGSSVGGDAISDEVGDRQLRVLPAHAAGHIQVQPPRRAGWQRRQDDPGERARALPTDHRAHGVDGVGVAGLAVGDDALVVEAVEPLLELAAGGARSPPPRSTCGRRGARRGPGAGTGRGPPHGGNARVR